MLNPDEILARLSRPDVAVERLLDEIRAPDLSIWEKHPELYLRFVERLIEQGHPGRALDLAREGAQHLHGNSQLQYQLALAASRGGNPRYAEKLLAPLLGKATGPADDLPPEMGSELQVDVIALQGRVLKDRSTREPELARQSAEWYERAAATPGAERRRDAGAFPLINAATMWRVAGDRTRSDQLAAEVVRRVEPSAESAAAAGEFWPAATLGEALTLLGRFEESVRWYRRAIDVALARGDLGSLASIRNNIGRLQAAGAAADPTYLDASLGKIVVFSGHLVDSPDRREEGLPPRFPNHPPLIAAVAAAIRRKLDELHATVGYCSLASGGDILFAEAMLDRGAELHVVLPFAQHDFLRISVDFGQHGAEWRSWRRRFDDVIDRLEQISSTRIRYATPEPYLGSDQLFAFTNSMLQGLAALRARERASTPTAVILLDPTARDVPGGAADFLKACRQTAYPVHEINLTELRQAHPAPPMAHEPPAAPAVTGALHRPVKAMVFADVVGYSKIKEWQLPRFLTSYAAYLRELFAAPAGRTAIYANTWGDGLYVVFDRAADAARFACELTEPTDPQPQWAALGLSTTFRVGLHAGPVFELADLFQGRSGFAGQHVNRAARIEPVTLHGCAYASEPFAALLMMEARDEFIIESVGVHSLAKDYDRCPLYRLQAQRAPQTKT